MRVLVTPGAHDAEPRMIDAPATAVSIRGLTKTFGSQVAVDGLTLSLDRGEIFGFLGPNGAGKSTTIRLLLGFIRPTAGCASILGMDCTRAAGAVHSSTGYLPGDVHVFPHLTGRAHTELVGSLRGIRDRQPLDELAAKLGLDLDRKAGAYSKGNRQKLGIILALIGQPPILLLDEPTSGLDPVVQHAVWDILRQQAAAGTTILFSSHVLGEVEQVCDRVGVLRQGKLVTVEPVASWRARQKRRMEVTFEGSLPGPGTFNLPGVREIQRHRSTIDLEIGNDMDSLIKVLARFPVLDLRTYQPTLEDLLLTYYQEDAP